MMKHGFRTLCVDNYGICLVDAHKLLTNHVLPEYYSDHNIDRRIWPAGSFLYFQMTSQHQACSSLIFIPHVHNRFPNNTDTNMTHSNTFMRLKSKYIRACCILETQTELVSLMSGKRAVFQWQREWTYRKVSNIRCTNVNTLMFFVSACSCRCAITWSQLLSGEWRCSWSSADRRCSSYVWVISNLIAY